MLNNQKRLGEIIVEKGLITDEQLRLALEEQRKTKEFLGRTLCKLKLIKDADLLAALSERFSIPTLSLKNRYIDWKFVKGFSPTLVVDHRCFPVERKGFALTFAITNPLDAWAQEKAKEEALGLKASFVLVLESEMDEIIKRYRDFLRADITKRI